MREILFRGKRDKRYSKSQDWVYGVPFTDSDGDCIMKNKSAERVVERETVGQFTGCCDKNGTKIFEGDIVLKRTYNGKKAFAVTFDDGMFHCGYGGGSSTATHGYTLADKQIEVIGNVYDNPELLKGDDKTE